MSGFPLERKTVSIPLDELREMQSRLRDAERVQKTLRDLQEAAGTAEARAKVSTGRLERLLSDLLLGVDDFERAIGSAEREESYPALLEGLRTIRAALVHALAAQEVSRFESLGQPFDSGRHQSIEGETAPGAGGVVREELRPGYERDGQVFRKAWVRVGPG